jgi:uncharacterized protein
MKILIAGSSGLVGSALCKELQTLRHSVFRLVRHPASEENQISWDPYAGKLEKQKIVGFDAVVNLAGESIASGRWSASKKALIISSRVNVTKFLCKALARASKRPTVLINASAIGYYGNRGTEVLTEHSQPGNGFLPEVCQAWEDAAQDAEHARIRVVKLRTGIVLTLEGGALQRMIVPFKLGMGGRLGSGDQYMSWITLQDEIAAIVHCITDHALSGPVNIVAPYAVTNSEFTAVLADVLSRPAIFPVPEFILKTLLGEMAEELLLGGARVMPEKLLNSGFKFQSPELKMGLRNILQ